MSRIDGRIHRLERKAGVVSTANTCATCGRLLHGPNKGRLPEGVMPHLIVTFGDDHGDLNCAVCGALTGLRIEFDKSG